MKMQSPAFRLVLRLVVLTLPMFAALSLGEPRPAAESAFTPPIVIFF